ncbi:hypothetical protein [Oscillatoria sp. FACHB-1407]|nr:hypothetical protein [Oscillatoria sp. FACHB-1407]
MTLTPVKWTVEDYHRMIDAGILSDRPCCIPDVSVEVSRLMRR